ncbi:MAG TPA: acyltransferase, partial [Candidatus Micrarchaeota archaeon]|nr:acyltransferase [Candidatus Micrarchaeota archaeon]
MAERGLWAVAIMRRLTTHPPFSPSNTLWDWHQAVHPIKVMAHFCMLEFCKCVPHLGLKNNIYRFTGMKVGKNAAIAPNVTIDFFYPELITIGDNAIIGYGATILAHEFLADCYKTGAVEIGDNAMVG